MASGAITEGDQTFTGKKTFEGGVQDSSHTPGAVSGTGATVSENGGPVHKTTITFTNTPVTMADEAGVVAYGSQLVYTFPAGLINFMGAIADIDLTKSSAGVDDDWNGDVGVGTAAASNNATLATTEQNLIPTTATPQASSGATTGDGQSTGTEAGTLLDGTSTPVPVYLNLLVDDADHDVTSTACNLILNGTLTLLWANIGDN